MITESLPLIYFGKLPSRGDFIRTRAHISETNALDQWVSQALAHSGAILDEATVLNFSHVDTVSGQIITGILIASHDSSHSFYQPHQLHLNTYLYRNASHYRLLLSFTKPSSDVLSTLFSAKNTYPADWVIIDDSAWTQSYIDEDIGLTRFNKLLLQDDLSLYDIRQLFKQIFLAQ